MSARSLSLLRLSRYLVSNSTCSSCLIPEKICLQTRRQPSRDYRQLCNEVRRNDHFDSVKEKVYSFEMNKQRPVENVRFVEYENLFALDILKEKFEYNYYESIARIYENSFEEYKQYMHLEAPAAIQKLLTEIDSYNISQIHALLLHLRKNIPFQEENENTSNGLHYNKNFLLICKQLDAACTRLLNTSVYKFDKSKQFLPFVAASNLWYELGVAKTIGFNRILMDKLSNFEGSLCKYSFLQLMFLINLQRDFPKYLRPAILKKTEDFLSNEDSISVKDLTLVAMGFFKTQTRMNQNVLLQFLKHCQKQFYDKDSKNFTTSLTSILKVIRYSFETADCDFRPYRLNVKQLVDAILAHPDEYINSSIVASHLIQTLNSSQLQDQKTIYKLVFDKMTEGLKDMRIKDIERVLFCMANATFMCNHSKLKIIEDYVYQSLDAQLYPYFVYSSFYYLRILGYHPRNLIKLMVQPEYLKHTIDTANENCYEVLIINDTILRLMKDPRAPSYRILSDKQIQEMRPIMHKKVVRTQNSKHSRFIRNIREVLQPKHGPAYQSMFLFPFSSYSFPVILDEKAQKRVFDLNTNENGWTDLDLSQDGSAIPYNPKFLVPNLFNGCTAFQVLLTKDFLWGKHIRGFANLNIRLLEALGFNVIQLSQRDFHSFILPDSVFDRNSREHVESANRLLNMY